MKVLEVLGGEYAGGGQEAFVFNLTENLLREGMDVECLIPYTMPENTFTSINTRLSQRLNTLGIEFDPGKSVNEIYRPFKSFLAKHHYDIVHIHSSRITMMSMMAAAVKRSGNAKVIVHAHSVEASDSLKHRVLCFLGSLVMHRYVDIYCACSKAAAEWKFGKRRAEGARIIKNGIDVESVRFDPVRRSKWRTMLGINDDTFVIGNVGRLSAEKNQAFLIDIMTAMKQENNLLLLVGNGTYRDKIESLVKDRGLTDKCLMVGNVDNVQDYLQAMDVFVMPSKYEGFGIAALESQGAGLPVVISNRVSQDAVITNDVIVMDLNRPVDEWIRAVDSFRMYKRRDNSQAVIAAGYDNENTVREVVGVYRSLIQGDRVGVK